jgi:hypothetical protein
MSSNNVKRPELDHRPNHRSKETSSSNDRVGFGSDGVLLRDQFSERQLSKTELTSVAKELIASMVPTPSDAKQ